MLNILVIGGAGYIGSHIVKELCDKDHNVAVFDNLNTGYKSNVDKRAKFIEGDILDEDALETTFSENKFDVVFHFAALKAAGESMIYPEKYSKVNITGTINVLNAMSRHNVKYFIFSSSAAVYGSPKYLPMDESHPLEPENYYGFTKLEIERILEWYSKIKDIHYAALRYFNAAGYGTIKGKEKNPANLLPVVLEVANGTRESMQVFGDDYGTKDGSCIRDYIHVLDLADAHIRAMNHIMKNNKDITVNLASEKGYSVLEVIKKAEEITGRKISQEIVSRRAGDPAVVLASSKKAHEILGWKATHSDIDTILKSMWNIYKS